MSKKQEKKRNLDIFNYLNFRLFLHDKYLESKMNYPYFSYRYFSKKAGFSSPNFLKLLIDGKRNLGREGIYKICKGFKLNQKESEFFENLVYMNQAKSHEEKNIYFKKLSKIGKFKNAEKLKPTQYEYYSKWYNIIIRELANLKSYRKDPEWISNILQPKITKLEAEKALQTLYTYNLLEENNKDDENIQKKQKMLTTGDEISSIAVKNFHKDMLKLANRSIDLDKPEDREISSLTIALSKSAFNETKRLIQNFRKELHSILEKITEQPTMVCHIGIQAFKVSKEVKDE